MTIARASHDGVSIAYETLGQHNREPMLLVMGLGMQMLAWPEEFCTELVGRGFAVVRYDNRDVGLSTHFRRAGTPSLPMILARPGAVASYRLADMADDAVAVLDALDWRSAHVVGISLGGMIAQTIAIRHPGRVRSLTSMMSTPSPRIGRARIRAMFALVPRPLHSRDQLANRMVKVFRIIGSTGYPLDEEWVREIARRSYDRGHDAGGVLRQLAAITASGDRRPALAGVRVPTLVLHGEADPLIRLAGARATAAAVPGSRLVSYPGMGHDLPSELWPAMIDEICRIADTHDRGVTDK
ncbi:MAG: alpha/beta fold hydrolase [Pseudonocardiaceae bacterium]|nr:alpha/beta fold hydrolase [Pseudonocardiaceae bacterium]